MSTVDPPLNSTSQPQYPLIDSDPHFSRVVRYMRDTDYAVWTAATVGWPTLLAIWDRTDRIPAPRGKGSHVYRLATLMGFGFGFLLAYQTSSKRFWGWIENSREEKLDFEEMSARAAAGKPLYGETTLDEFTQTVAANNSRYIALMFPAFPWFNIVNHNRHGVDTSKYYKPRQPS